MFDENQLAQLEANWQRTQGARPATRQPQRKKKSFLLDQISTAGGILGGIGGSFVAPIAGTAAGAGAGSALGETLENALMGESLGKNVAKEGALGAVFGAGPLKLLKGGAALAAGKGVQAASQAATTPLRQKAGKALVGAGDDLLIKQFRLTPTQLTNFQKKFGEDAAQTIKKYGFQNADDIASKGIEPLQQQFDDAVRQIPGVTKDKLAQSFKSKYEPLIKSGVEDNVALGRNLKNQANTLLKKYGDVIPSEDLASVRREFDSLVNYTERAANPSRYGVNKRAADAIRETLQKSDPSGTLKGLGQELSKLRQLSDAAAKQGNLGRGNLPLNLPTLLGGGAGAAAGGPLFGVGSAMTTAAVNSPTGRRVVAGGVDKVGGSLLKSGQKAAGQSARGITTRLSGLGAVEGLTNQAQSDSLEDALLQGQSFENSAINPSASPNNIPPMSNSITDQQYQTDSQMSSSPYSRDNLLADIRRDPQNSEKYMEFYAMLDKIFNPEGEKTKPLGGEAQKRALTAQSGLRSLGTLEETLASDPGAFQRQALPNPLGITARLTGTTDTRAATDNLVDVIARLRSGAAITDEEAARFARLLPRPGDSSESARFKLQNVRAELESFMNPGPSLDLESALMSAQGTY